MKICPNCHNETEDLALSCPVCGTALDAIGHIPAEEPSIYHAQQMPVMEITPPRTSKHNRTADYSQTDIQENRIVCMCVYLLGVFGVIIALLMAPGSDYTRFHVNQSLKFTVLEALLAVISVLLFWTVLIPVLCALAMLVLMVAKLLCFVDVVKNQAVLSPVLHLIRFLN